MNTKLLLTAAGETPDGLPVVLIQLLATLLFAFAMVNWVARGSLIGGIYNRPVAVGNVTHFAIGALTLSRALVAGQRSVIFCAVTVLYIVFAVGFGLVLFRSPVVRSGTA